MVVVFRVQGMSCDHCVATIESAVQSGHDAAKAILTGERN